MILLLLVIVSFSAVVAVLLFGDSPNYRNTPIHTFHSFLMRTNARVARSVQSNSTVYRLIRWSVPLFYVVVVTFCIFQFFKWVYPALDAAIVTSHIHSACIALSIAGVLFSTVLVIFSDPGTLTDENAPVACSSFTNNGLIFFNKNCQTCHLEKPARSKHCSVCNKCVLLYDHHCIWVNNCIGYKNYRWFMAFLVSNINLMVYGGYLCWRELRAQPRPNGWWKLIVASSENNRIAGILLILASFISVITSLFAGLHIRYLYLGVTTNEAEKWGEIEHLVAMGVLYYVVEKDVYVEEASTRSADGTFEMVYLRLNGDNKIAFTSREKSGLTFMRISSVETDLNNIYDRGFWENVKERIFI